FLLEKKKNQIEIELGYYSQADALKNSKKVIDFFQLKGLYKNVLIKLNEEVFLPEKQDTLKNKEYISVKIYANEEFI
ncbi:MAG TPA: hypothetical protein DIV86_02200, partial [Alphaproteobacteria bacterium]|nr:hypothetical protein [Alphaproteobacteria bacterium]